MLTRTFYVGIIRYGGEVYQASHPCFIGKSLFVKVQQQIHYKDRHHCNRANHDFKLTGLIKCKECGAGITAEQHTKHYKRTKRKATYIYYRCTKKAGPCHQPYISKNNLVSQLTKSIHDVALPPSWTIKWRSWLKRDEAKAKKKVCFSISKQKQELETIDQKLDTLLDLHLDQGIDSRGYKKKKNQLFNKKLKTQDKITKIKTNGSHWLEPFNQFIKDAIIASKTCLPAGTVARKENMDSNLKQIAQSVGSNFFLQDKKLIINYKKPFASLRVTACTRAKNPEISESLLCVTPRGIEPRFVG
ncbi:zinc ribbon domain-containing protein [Patescibacteria group bacterium]|nr:zinc ribbon domain-containing protein [Patescibacteria group bacterium]MBU4265203.1 zinc ribbon domain-containing protein [Patescibacteria group bacterium]MBU4390767.1 zinc ribbon domain-containing protein [Patescibacteria group bacterium]MBU4396689.1 zinc ribbon domain-containing protein [Patescibacteria group bacterium]MBU4431175.1 zinc ribbon domain-containing protein [Patescibacteria group bacterium]